jgi:hypothetical protein
MLQWLYTYVASFCSKCFICFSNVCYKYVYLNVTYVLHICCKCFIWMLHMFFNSFSSVLRCFRKYFIRIFQAFHLSSHICCKYFIWMFQKQIGCCNWGPTCHSRCPSEESRGGASGLCLGSGGGVTFGRRGPSRGECRPGTSTAATNKVHEFLLNSVSYLSHKKLHILFPCTNQTTD